MTLTNELRARLDERGINWWTDKYYRDTNTCWRVGDFEWRASEKKDGKLLIGCTCVKYLTPEQAIAATVGARDYTYDEWRAINDAVGDAMEYAHEHAVMYPDKADPLWNIDEYVNRVLEVAYGPKDATMGAGTCHMEICDNLDESEGMGDVWLECDKCHWQMMLEPTTPRFKYCPNCGSRVVDE